MAEALKNIYNRKFFREFAVRPFIVKYPEKMNATLSKKVYQISEKAYPGNSETRVKRKQSFRIISTRRFHPGLHQLSIIAQ